MRTKDDFNAIRQEIKAAIEAVAVKHGLHHNEWDYVDARGRPMKGGRILIREANATDGDPYILIDASVKKW